MDGSEIIRLAVEIEKLIHDLPGDGDTIGEQIHSLKGNFSPKLNRCLKIVRRARNEYAHNYSMPIPQSEYFELSNFCIRELEILVLQVDQGEILGNSVATDTPDDEERRAKGEAAQLRAGLGDEHLLQLLEAHRRDERLARMRALRQSQLDGTKISEIVDSIVKSAEVQPIADTPKKSIGFFRSFAYGLSEGLKEKLPKIVKDSIIKAIDKAIDGR